MRILFSVLASSALLAGTAFADHHEKKAASYGSHSSYGSGTDGHAMMDHGDGHMNGHKTMPADGAVLEHSPAHVGVDFGHAMTVETMTLTLLTGEVIELDVTDVGQTRHVMVATPELQSDDYTVDWRARGADGHIMSGSFAFTVE